MTETARRGAWAIWSSLAVALFLTILPMPVWLDGLRPQWLALTLIFWCLYLPQQVAVFWAFGTGLVLDVTAGSLLGHHALGFSVIAFVVVEVHPRLRSFPLWQQTLVVWLLLLAERLLHLWVLGASGQPTPPLGYWLPTLISALLWPWASAVLRGLGRRAGVW